MLIDASSTEIARLAGTAARTAAAAGNGGGGIPNGACSTGGAGNSLVRLDDVALKLVVEPGSLCADL